MDLAEATRQYQATLTACRSAVDPEEFMDEELEAAERVMNAEWLRHTVYEEGVAAIMADPDKHSYKGKDQHA